MHGQTDEWMIKKIAFTRDNRLIATKVSSHIHGKQSELYVSKWILWHCASILGDARGLIT